MAMIRILWEVAYQDRRQPDFKNEPYDLGSFREIVHLPAGGDSRAQEFFAGFEIGDWNCEAVFRKGSFITEVHELRIANPRSSISWHNLADGSVGIDARTDQHSWRS